MLREHLPALRAFVFAVLAAWIVLSPGLNQALGLRLPWVRTWRMYARVGVDVCDVTYYERTRSGDVPLDYVRILHGAPWWRVAPHRRRVMRDNLQRVGRDVCRQIDARDVRADAVCARPSGWEPELARERNLCGRRR